MIYDLDNFTPSQITPLTFENRNAPYPIPIIDTRSPKQYDSLKLSQPYEKIYNSICLAIANKILQDLNIDTNNRLEVANYIKKINLLQNTEFTSSEDISSILEIDGRFYSYNLSQANLEDIIFRRLPILELNRVINENPNYNFVLFSSYAKLSGIKTALKQQFQNTLFAPNLNIKSDFLEIWQQETVRNFPLFGQHLDRISFSVRRSSENKSSENIEICLPDEICYEGEKEAIVYGEYPKDGKLEQNFSLKTKDVTLPFRINDKPFFINNETDVESETGIEQIYKIENQYFNETPNLDIRIRFRLQPGLAPKLEILDNYKRIIDSKLIDFQKLVVQNLDELGFISKQEIFTFRKIKSQRFTDVLKTQTIQIPIALSDFTHEMNNSIANIISIDTIEHLNSVSRSFLNLIQNYSYSYSENKSKNGLEVYVIDSKDKNKNLENFTQNYKNLDKRVKEFLETIKFNGITKQSSISQSCRNIYSNIFQILGKSFVFSESLNLDFLYDSDQIYYGNLLTKDNRFIYSIHLHNIARMACTNERRKGFWNLFNLRSKYHQKEFYKVDDYIWGYARILLWYANFEDDRLLLEIFSQHFTQILCHCLTLNISSDREYSSNRKYLTDALIALIYLLTFREIDSQFVERGSLAYNQSKKLCEKLMHTKIKSQKANLKIPLNQFFEQLLDGSATQEQVSNMIEID